MSADSANTDTETRVSEVDSEAGNISAQNDRLLRLEQENSELKDRLLRTLAEMENLRRRTERENQEARLYASSKFASDMVVIADNLRRAIDAMPKDLLEKEDNAVKSLVNGIELTERELIKTFERHNIKKRDPKGERFNPNFDQAIFEIEDPTQIIGTVMEVVQVGYTIGERVLRPSMVGVAKGGMAPPRVQPKGAGAFDPSHPSHSSAQTPHAQQDLGGLDDLLHHASMDNPAHIDKKA